MRYNLEETASETTIRTILRDNVIVMGIPGAMAFVGMLCLLMPWISSLSFFALWSCITASLCIAYMYQSWSSHAGAWVFLAASAALASGIIVNCHYYVVEWGSGDVSRPILMNLDAWSAWNNALAENGRPDAVRCDWPARGYGLLVGTIVRVFGADITYPLLFNAICTLATILLTASITQHCAGGSRTERRNTATFALIAAASMCYFMVSGTILIKDCPLAFAVSLTAWTTIRLRHIGIPLSAIYIATACIIIFYCRTNYFLVIVVLMAALTRWRDFHSRMFFAAAFLIIAGLWIYAHHTDYALQIKSLTNLSNMSLSDKSGEISQHNFYHRLFGHYYSFSVWQRLLLLPVTTAIQFIIPLPWTFDKYMQFGPDMAIAHFSFCRYMAGALVLFYIIFLFRQKNRAPLLRIITAIGVLFYIASAYQYGGTISRYGIPLISLLIPCTAYVWQNCRTRKLFRIWCAAFGFMLVCVLAVCYHLTSL